MMISQLVLGLLLIICGFLVKKFPNLIAGYNTMSQAEKDKVNITALALFLKQLLVGLGAITIASSLVFKALNIPENTSILINTIVITLGIVFGLIYANTNKKFKR